MGWIMLAKINIYWDPNLSTSECVTKKVKFPQLANDMIIYLGMNNRTNIKITIKEGYSI